MNERQKRLTALMMLDSAQLADALLAALEARYEDETVDGSVNEYIFSLVKAAQTQNN